VRIWLGARDEDNVGSMKSFRKGELNHWSQSNLTQDDSEAKMIITNKDYSTTLMKVFLVYA
jgi:hypothetical protein